MASLALVSASDREYSHVNVSLNIVTRETTTSSRIRKDYSLGRNTSRVSVGDGSFQQQTTNIPKVDLDHKSSHAQYFESIQKSQEVDKRI